MIPKPANEKPKKIPRYHNDVIPKHTNTKKSKSGYDENHCPNCGNMISDNDLFCINCGYKLAKRFCPNCGTPITDDLDVFCFNCGQKL